MLVNRALGSTCWDVYCNLLYQGYCFHLDRCGIKPTIYSTNQSIIFLKFGRFKSPLVLVRRGSIQRRLQSIIRSLVREIRRSLNGLVYPRPASWKTGVSSECRSTMIKCLNRLTGYTDLLTEKMIILKFDCFKWFENVNKIRWNMKHPILKNTILVGSESVTINFGSYRYFWSVLLS